MAQGRSVSRSVAHGEAGVAVNDELQRELLIAEVNAQRTLMEKVATGGPAINSVNDQYMDRHNMLVSQLAAFGLTYNVPYEDLWNFYDKWSKDLPTYRSRRKYLSDVFRPIVQALREPATAQGARVFPEPTGWAKVDNTLTLIRTRLQQAKTEVEWQGVGLLCREALIDVAQTVYDSFFYPTADGVEPSPTDAKRQLDAYLSAELAGGSNEAARRHAKAALDLANDLQHRRTATFREAALCAEATTSVINLISIISGQRDP